MPPTGRARRVGALDTLDDVRLGDHVCWPYEGPAERAALVRTQAAQLEPDTRMLVATVADGGAREARDTEDRLLHAWLDDGTTVEVGVDDLTDLVVSALSSSQPAWRIVVDVGKPHDVAGLLRTLHRLDQLTLGRAAATVCLYPANDWFPHESALRCVHPLSKAPGPSFRLHATPRGLAITGEIGSGELALLGDTFPHLVHEHRDGPLTLDLAHNGFLSRRALQLLVAEAAAAGRGTLRLLDPPPSSRRAAALLDLDVEIVPSSADRGS